MSYRHVHGKRSGMTHGQITDSDRRKAVFTDAGRADPDPLKARSGFLMLAGANFCVALGYGIVLPFVPLLVEHVSGATPLRTHAFHIGALLGIYPLAIFLTAPYWGRAADRLGGKNILIIGLGGYAFAMAALVLADSMINAYLLRAAAGVSAGAVLPVVASMVGKVIDLRRRARLFAGLSVATLLGLIAGPAASGSAYAVMEHVIDAKDWSALAGPLLIGAAALVTLQLAGVVRWIPAVKNPVPAVGSNRATDWRQASFVLLANFTVLLGLGAFEAVLPLVGKTQLPFDTGTLGLLLAGCMLVMIVVQVVMFLTPVLRSRSLNRLIAAAFVVMAAGAALLSATNTMVIAVVAIALLASGAAFLEPAIYYMATLKTGGNSAALLGGLTAVGSLGQALGSFFGGMLFGFVEARVLWMVAALLFLTAVSSYASPSQVVLSKVR